MQAKVAALKQMKQNGRQRSMVEDVSAHKSSEQIINRHIDKYLDDGYT